MHRLTALALLLAPAAAHATTADLMRAQHTDIGDVTVTDDGTTLYVDIATDEGWAMDEIHVAAGCDVSDLPTTKKGNPQVGRFPAGDSGICADTASYSFDLADLGCEDEVVVAVHAVSVDAIDYVVGDLTTVEEFEAYTKIRATTGTSSYLNLQVDGVSGYEAWCVDLGTTIFLNRTYTDVMTLSSYSSDAEDWVDKPENLDLINYILNTDYGYLGANKADVQTAMWQLIDDSPRTEPGSVASRWKAIVADARMNGEGYEPDVDGVYGVLFVRDVNGDGVQEIQVLAVPVMVPLDPVCGTDDETAWADGDRFVSRGSWAMYMTHAL